MHLHNQVIEVCLEVSVCTIKLYGSLALIPGSCDTRERGSLVHTVHRPFQGRVASKVGNCYLCCHVVTPIFMTIIIVQMTQISNMKVIGLMVDLNFGVLVMSSMVIGKNLIPNSQSLMIFIKSTMRPITFIFTYTQF